MNEIDTQYEVLKMSQQDYKSSVTNRGESLKSDSSFDGVNNTNDGPMRGQYFRQVTNEEPGIKRDTSKILVENIN